MILASTMVVLYLNSLSRKGEVLKIQKSDNVLDLKPGRVIMLILTRRVGEKLIIGETVTVTVLGVKGNQIRLGVEAPRDIQVHREEIFKRILKEREKLNGAASRRVDVTSIQNRQ